MYTNLQVMLQCTHVPDIIHRSAFLWFVSMALKFPLDKALDGPFGREWVFLQFYFIANYKGIGLK